MRPVGGAERVVDEEVLARDQLLGEGQIARLLAGVEAEVLAARRPGRRRRRPHAAARAVGARTGPMSYGRVGLALGPAQVAGRGDPGRALVEQPGEGLQRQPDAQVVGDAAVGHGHVEIRAHQDVLALDRRQVLEDGDSFLHR